MQEERDIKRELWGRGRNGGKGEMRERWEEGRDGGEGQIGERGTDRGEREMGREGELGPWVMPHSNLIVFNLPPTLL